MMTIPAYSADMIMETGLPQPRKELSKRGLNVYTMSDVLGISGRARDGQIIRGTIEIPRFILEPEERADIVQKCDAVFGVVSGRMQRIAGLEWSVVRESILEDRIELYLKQCKQIFDEYANAKELRYQVIRFSMRRKIMEKLPDCLPDLSNFQPALLRWKKRIEMMNEDASTEIEDWLHQPNPQDNFDDLIKKWVFDLLTHGGAGLYKDKTDGKVEHLYMLPGGTITPLKNRYIGPMKAYAQIIPGMDPKIYFSDEVMWSPYMPTSGLGYGLIPLEALVNKVAETLFFDIKAANMADGTVAPEKAVVFGGQPSPFGSLTGEDRIMVPLEKEEQTRLETLFNEPRKNAVRVISGNGTPDVIDLTRSEIFKDQSERQRFIREAVAFVYNATNMEVNLTGSDDTSGRSTSEAQAAIEKEKGIYPIVKDIENDLNQQILPMRFGSGYLFQYKSGLSEKEQAELDQAKIATGTYPVNEVRLARGDEPLGTEYDVIQQGAGAAQGMTPDGSQARPFNMRAM